MVKSVFILIPVPGWMITQIRPWLLILFFLFDSEMTRDFNVFSTIIYRLKKNIFNKENKTALF